jgi:hypothetical protein
MTNEFDGTETDQAWVALTGNDPAQLAPNPDLSAIKASIFSDATKVAPISKRSWLAPVAVAASVALFVGGGAGYTIAAQSSSDSSFVYAPISAPEQGAAIGSQDAKMSSSSAWGWGGRAYLEAGSDISDTSGVQVGYTFNARDVDRKAQLELIADAFSVVGKVNGSKTDGYFTGDRNYAKAVAQISGSSWDLSQLVTWNYSDASVNPTYCGGDMPMSDTSVNSKGSAATSEPMSTSVPQPVPEPIKCTVPKGTLPSNESALALAREKFSSIGFDSEAIWTVTDNGSQWGYNGEMASAYKLVTVKVFIDGIYSNQSWTLTVGPDNKILSANGFFAKFVPTTEFQIVGAKTAIERTQDGLWINLPPQEVYKEGMVYPMDLALGGNPSAIARNKSGQPVLDSGLDRGTILKAETSLVSWYLNDGSTILLPAYLLSESNAADSRQWLQLAIADEYIDFS